MNWPGQLLILLVAGGWPAIAAAPRGGGEIYRAQCAECHGAKGEGVAGKYDEPLHGNRSLESLTRLIDKTMPENAPEKCRGEDAARVAQHIFDAFYSPEAWRRNHPARIELARLTQRQYLNTVADLVSGPPQPVDDRRGLTGHYGKTRRIDRGKAVFSRTDGTVAFQFGEASPDTNQIPAAEFSVQWTGSVIAEETGDYEFIVKTENGVRLWVNDLENDLIDGWVSSGREPREQRATLRLLGGRAYPLQLDWFKYKDKTASIELRWKPPHKVEEVIPQRCLTPAAVRPTFVVSTVFPPDDSSVGYERGTAVSRAWDQAATQAAIAAASHIERQLDSLSNSRKRDDNRGEKLKAFCVRFVERAFRRPLTPAERRDHVEVWFEGAAGPETAVKRVVLLALKSPRFLYPGLAAPAVDDYEIAARLALGLWDSLPDDELLKAAAAGQLRSPDRIAAQSERMLRDPRTRAKLRYFFHQWLQMNEAEDIAKDTELFPGFDASVIADLRTSLDLFIDDIVWSPGSDYRQLLLADHMFLNRRLAQFYGVKDVPPERFERVVLGTTQRAGVVTHPYLLSTFAYANASSPIHRGVFLTRNLLGRTLRPPPMAIEFKDSQFDPGLTMREKVTELTKPAACHSCHSVINPIGFSLENYDAVGRFRTEENRKPVDARGVYETEDGREIRINGARDLAEFAARDEAAQKAFIIQLFNQVVKQPVQAYGPDALARLHASFRTANFSIRRLLVEILKLSAPHAGQMTKAQ